MDEQQDGQAKRRRPGPKRIYATAAERQAAYRQRQREAKGRVVDDTAAERQARYREQQAYLRARGATADRLFQEPIYAAVELIVRNHISQAEDPAVALADVRGIVESAKRLVPRS